jgi:predicted amidohydrolase
MKLVISLAQLHLKLGDPKANLELAVQMIKGAAEQNSQFILFPELWSTGYDLEHAASYQSANQAILSELAQLASQHHLFIGGSLLEEKDGRFYNTFKIISPAGEIKAAYQKVHLFGLMAEDQWLQAGSQLQTCDFPWGKAGLAICYDLRFPEMFRHYTLQDNIQILLIPAEWPLRRVAHWRTLLRARAIENQIFVAAVNTAGQIGDETFGGASVLLDPWGEALVEGNQTGSDLLTAAIDLDLIQTVRSRLTALKDRRPELY